MPVAPEDLIAALPCWRGALEISPLPGGLSNASYKVVDADGRLCRTARARLSVSSRLAPARGGGEPRGACGRAGAARRAISATACWCSTSSRAARSTAAGFSRAPARRSPRWSRARMPRCARRVRGEAGAFWVFHVIRDYLDALRPGRRAPVAGRAPAELRGRARGGADSAADRVRPSRPAARPICSTTGAGSG